MYAMLLNRAILFKAHQEYKINVFYPLLLPGQAGARSGTNVTNLNGRSETEKSSAIVRTSDEIAVLLFLAGDRKPRRIAEQYLSCETLLLI